MDFEEENEEQYEDEDDFDIIFTFEDDEIDIEYEKYTIIFIDEGDEDENMCKYLKCIDCDAVIARDLPEIGLNWVQDSCPDNRGEDCINFGGEDADNG